MEVTVHPLKSHWFVAVLESLENCHDRRGGYAERPYRTVGGRAYYQRTYVYGGRSYARVYGRYPYRGGYYYRYYPTAYYHPVYYGWAYNPWPAPVAYGWGWGGSPWYGYYGAYFTPYPVYPSASVWLAHSSSGQISRSFMPRNFSRL